MIALRRGREGSRTVGFGGHLDTVFPEGTDVTVRQRGDTLFAPGIGDDTRGLIVVLTVLRALEDNGLLFAVRSASLDFLRPARFNDRLAVSVRLAQRRRASLVLDQAVSRIDDRQGPLCTGQVKIACLDAGSFNPQPIPEFIYKELPDVG